MSQTGGSKKQRTLEDLFNKPPPKKRKLEESENTLQNEEEKTIPEQTEQSMTVAATLPKYQFNIGKTEGEGKQGKAKVFSIKFHFQKPITSAKQPQKKN